MAILGIYAANTLILPMLLIGMIRTTKAKLQGRQGPSIVQPFFDIAKLLRKGETISVTSFWAFNAAPIINIAVMIAISFSTPWLGISSPFSGDLFLFAYLLVLAKCAASLSALDSGSSFGAIGASRESAISIFSEVAIVASLSALGMQAHGSSFTRIFAPVRMSLDSVALDCIVAAALWLASMADLSRMPFDDPTTHLELTMIHEAQVLENSGRNLAVVQYSEALRLSVLLGLISRVVINAFPPMTSFFCYLLTLAAIAIATMFIAVSESTLIRLRWRRLPNLLSFAISAAMVACLLAAMKG